MKIPFSPPYIKEEEIKNVIEVLKSGWITTGPKTKEFERRISDYCNTEKTVCLNSATACLEMTLRILGIGKGDEVITCAYTYTASASIIEHVGAKIILVDTKEDSFEMDYDKLSKLINENTKAIISVDLAGIMCDYDKLFEIVNSKANIFKAKNKIQELINRVIIIADGAHSFGATYKGKKSGEVADFTSFSFHAVKNLTTAEGGALTWNVKGLDNDEIYRKITILSLHGQTKDALEKNSLGSWEYDIIEPAFKCNMTDISAVLGLAQLDRYKNILEHRRNLIELYNKEFKNTKEIQLLNHYSDIKQSSGHLYIIRLINKDIEYRNKIIEELAKRGIATNVHYKPLPLLTAYKKLGFNIKDYPNSYKMYENEITLPLNNVLNEEQVKYICNNLKELISVF